MTRSEWKEALGLDNPKTWLTEWVPMHMTQWSYRCSGNGFSVVIVFNTQWNVTFDIVAKSCSEKSNRHRLLVHCLGHRFFVFFFLLPILLGKVNSFCAPISLSINIICDHSSNPASVTEILSSSRGKKKKLCLKSFKKFKGLVSIYWILHRYFLSLWGFSHIFCVLELDGPDNNLIFILQKYVREANTEYFTQAWNKSVVKWTEFSEKNNMMGNLPGYDNHRFFNGDDI